MKPFHDRIGLMIRYIIVLIIFVYSVVTNAQILTSQDSVRKILKGSLIQQKDFKIFITKDTLFSIPTNLVKTPAGKDTRTDIFYDSLKTRASKKFLTKALIDLVIVRPDSSDQKKITTSSDSRFSPYRGVRIRKITIKRLNIFGVDISNPGYYKPGGLEKFLNDTHVNTNEKIIRKNIIFREGDTISPLRLAENERLLRQLPYIEDARILVVPVSSEEADIVVITKDVYSLGASLSLKSASRGSFYFFDSNIFGSGHKFRIEIPYSSSYSDSPGIGLSYYLNNIRKSFINMTFSYYNGLGKTSYGVSAIRNLVSSESKYAGGITINQVYTTTRLDTTPVLQPLHYNYQDYWLQRSFLLNREKVQRLTGGIRFINDNIFVRPQINPNSYYALQKKAMLLGSITFSQQKFYKTNLIYNYGRAEDIPYGGMFNITGGIERNEFKNRAYLSANGAIGGSFEKIGYLQLSSGIGGFLRDWTPEQGVLTTGLMYVSNLSLIGKFRLRNFINLDYTRGFARYSDEHLGILRENGFTGFWNDSIKAGQRFNLSLESVLFTPGTYLGFRFAVFGFADMDFLAGTRQIISEGLFLSALGIGIRIRNDNLVFNTFQIRLAFFPNAPLYTRESPLIVSGEELLHPPTFDPVPPAIIPYR